MNDTPTAKPAALITAELALLSAWRRYDALDKDGADAWQRIRNGEAYCRAHPEDRAAGGALSKLRAADGRAWPDVLKAMTAYERAHGADGATWPLEAETRGYLEERRALCGASASATN
jgi:hypothetical protein